MAQRSIYMAGPVQMMKSSNGNVFFVAGHLWGEPIGRRWIPLTKASDTEALVCSLICGADAGNLRRQRAYNDVTVM